ncbi:MAG: glutathione peroxidase [Betaproteobacteria bacterium]|nr:glutathione peroxidase [Betaproteobacteria bacterium]
MKVFLFLFFWMLPAMTYAACSSLYNHQFDTLQGDKINLCDYQSKPILAVNTASKCGFTPQFNALEALYKKYQDKGLLVIGFPSNDFNQELSTDKEVRDFCKLTYAVDFPMTTKSSVTGKNANPFYQELIKTSGQMPKWNFFKYLILPQGKKVYAFTSDVTPDSPAILDKIKTELN